MANLFIGFPVPRAKIADMIEGAAPPLNHIVNHRPPGSDPLVLPDDIEDDQIVKWNGTKFIGTAEPAGGNILSPISLPAAAFRAEDDNLDFFCDATGLRRGTSTDAAYFYHALRLPHGVTLTRLTLFGYRDDANSLISLHIFRVSNAGATVGMIGLDSNWTDGEGSITGTSFMYATINNNDYAYVMRAYIVPNDAVGDVILRRAKLEFS